jgi:hypothetical protein
MTVSASDLAELQRFAANAPDIDANDLSALQTIPEVLGYMIACARHDGDDEVDAAELLIRFTELSPDDVRGAEGVLRRLGYIQVADMMKKIAGRRKYDLAPLK